MGIGIIGTNLLPSPASLIRPYNGAARKHVVHLGKYYPPSAGGIETHTRTLAQAQTTQGWDVTVVVINHASHDGTDATFDTFSQSPEVEEWDGAVRVIRVGRWANVAKLDIAPGLIRVLRRIARNKPDIWHMHAPNPTMMFATAAMKKLRPLVITHHSDIIRQKTLRHLLRPVENRVYGDSALLITDSPPYIEGSQLLQHFPHKTIAIPLGIDLKEYLSPDLKTQSLAESFRKRYSSPLWVCIGRLIYYKGFEFAIRALEHVPGKLLMIGTGPLEAELKNLAHQLRLTDRVVWLGRASSSTLTAALHAATAFWFPSIARSEAFGLVQVEAMASGCPVINTAIPGSGVDWVCRHEMEGLTVPTCDAVALSRAALRLLNEPGLRERLSNAGRQRAIAEFTDEVMCQRSLQAYERVCSLRENQH